VIHRASPLNGSNAPEPCRRLCRRGRPDASLPAAGDDATLAAGRHDVRLRAACADSAAQPGARTPAAGCEHTRQRSRCCRDRSGRRCVPAHRSAGSCRAGNPAPGATPPPPPDTGQRRGRAGIKGLQNASLALHRRPGDATPINISGPSLLVVSRPASIADTFGRALATDCSQASQAKSFCRPTAGRLRCVQSRCRRKQRRLERPCRLTRS
jgi:hypothetical protein